MKITNLTFDEVYKFLMDFQVIRRKGWNGKNIYVFRQVPAEITEDIIPKMTSLPDAAKGLILNTAKKISYTSQMLIYNTKTGRADSWVPSSSDIMANDWEVLPTDLKPEL